MNAPFYCDINLNQSNVDYIFVSISFLYCEFSLYVGIFMFYKLLHESGAAFVWMKCASWGVTSPLRSVEDSLDSRLGNINEIKSQRKQSPFTVKNLWCERTFDNVTKCRLSRRAIATWTSVCSQSLSCGILTWPPCGGTTCQEEIGNI